MSKNLEEVRIEDANLADNDDGVLEMHSDKEDDILNEDIEGDEVEEDQDEDWNAQDEERGAGDGQEQKDEKVDDDEDRRNPQYIPKKGMFYEHDDRIDSGDEESKEGAEKTETETDKPRRVPRSEATEKWGHDKFLERDQIPKSKEELVSTYGYDIRYTFKYYVIKRVVGWGRIIHELSQLSPGIFDPRKKIFQLFAGQFRHSQE